MRRSRPRLGPSDAAIAAALVPVTLSNAPLWSGNTTWELLKGGNVLRNLNFTGPLLASLQNNTDTLRIECAAYRQAETDGAISAAIDALPDYATQAQVDASISDALVPYYTAAQVDAEIAANGVDLSDYYTKSQSDSRYFVQRAGGGNTSLVRDNVTPPTIRNLLPRAPLSTSIQFSGTVVELNCDAYSKSESDSRYIISNANGSFNSLVAGHRDAAADQGPAAQGALQHRGALQQHAGHQARRPGRVREDGVEGQQLHLRFQGQAAGGGVAAEAAQKHAVLVPELGAEDARLDHGVVLTARRAYEVELSQGARERLRRESVAPVAFCF